MEPTTTYFDLLPDEDVLEILIQIESLETLSKLCQASTRLASLCKDNVFWKNKYKMDFGDQPLPDGNWRLGYIIRTKSKESNLLSAGLDHVGVIDKNGFLFMGGNNLSGQLGDGTAYIRKNPVRIPFDSKIICVSCGAITTGAVTERGEVFLWGSTSGLGIQTGAGIIMVPTKINVPNKIVKISIGPNLLSPNIGALAQDGSIYHWRFGKPVKLETNIKMIDIAATGDPGVYLSMISQDLKLYHSFFTLKRLLSVKEYVMPEPILSVSNGKEYTGVLSVNGNIYLWGQNDAGQLGIGHPGILFPRTGQYNLGTIGTDLYKISIPSPITFLSCRNLTTSVITLDNKLYMWGSNLENKIFIEKLPTSGRQSYQELYPPGYFIAGADVNEPLSFNVGGGSTLALLYGSIGREVIELPSLATPTQIDIGYPIKYLTTGRDFTIAKTTDGRINQWGNLLGT